MRAERCAFSACSCVVESVVSGVVAVVKMALCLSVGYRAYASELDYSEFCSKESAVRSASERAARDMQEKKQRS